MRKIFVKIFSRTDTPRPLRLSMKIQTHSSRLIREKQKQAQALQTQAIADVQDYRQKLEKDFGIPIVMESLGDDTGAGGTVRPYWDQRTRVRCHSIALASCESWARPHKLGHELTHIALECEAFAAGRRRTSFQSKSTTERLLAMCDPAKTDDPWVLKKIVSYSRNVPVDMVVESRLKQRFSKLAPAQFVNVHSFEERIARDAHLNRPMDASPKFLLALDSMVAARALFVDRSFESPFKHFDRFQNKPAGDLAQQLCDEFQGAFDHGMSPDDHYRLIDRFSEIVGFSDMHEWVAETAFEIIEQLASNGPEL